MVSRYLWNSAYESYRIASLSTYLISVLKFAVVIALLLDCIVCQMN
jgi:hypothetical protein